MIRCIVAIDEKRGMANDNGIPWAGKIPTDIKYYHEKTSKGLLLMGYGTYVEFKKPFHNRTNYVATNSTEPLRPGFKIVNDAREFIKNTEDDVWVLGGAGLISHTLDLMDELYITQLKGDFNCTKFFPEFKDKFRLKSESEPIVENEIEFTFQVWVKK